ncbi:putative SP-containing protein [Vairimorpha necatrix]|uniref:SP-containing protein n=1 Tax=Vairimorpha necatrix TaxID=6039 RepID=A0AAX4J9Z6_9MICR
MITLFSIICCTQVSKKGDTENYNFIGTFKKTEDQGVYNLDIISPYEELENFLSSADNTSVLSFDYELIETNLMNSGCSDVFSFDNIIFEDIYNYDTYHNSTQDTNIYLDNKNTEKNNDIELILSY